MCDKCSPFSGLWQKTDTGLRRCDCADGKRLASEDLRRRSGTGDPPRISEEEALAIAEMIAGQVNYFPPRDAPIERSSVAMAIRSMCSTVEEGSWLAQRIGQLYKNWPGTREMRMVFCSKFFPLDAIEPTGVSDFYPEGIPSEAESRGTLPAPEMKYLSAPKGEPVTAADSLNEFFYDLAAAKSMKNVGRVRPPSPPPVMPAGQYVTQADIDAAVLKNRERIAREQIGS